MLQVYFYRKVAAVTVAASAASRCPALQVWDTQEGAAQRGEEEAELVSGSEEPTSKSTTPGETSRKPKPYESHLLRHPYPHLVAPPTDLASRLQTLESEEVDLNANLHGNWTLENAKARLNQFFQKEKITADYKYSQVGPDHNRSDLTAVQSDVCHTVHPPIFHHPDTQFIFSVFTEWTAPYVFLPTTVNQRSEWLTPPPCSRHTQSVI